MKLSEILFGKRVPWQSDVDYEASKPLSCVVYLFIVFVAVSVIRFVVALLGG